MRGPALDALTAFAFAAGEPADSDRFGWESPRPAGRAIGTLGVAPPQGGTGL